jgi:hypothetical protein
MPVKTVPTGRRKVKKSASATGKRRSARSGKTRKGGLNRHLKKTISAALLFFISALFIAGLGYFKNMSRSFVSADEAGYFHLSGKDLYSVLLVSVKDFDTPPVVTDSITFNLIDKKNKKILQYDIPVSAVFDIPGKYGEEELGKVFALGSINDLGGYTEGIELLDKTVTSLFGYKVNRFILVDSSLSSQMHSLIKGNEAFSVLALKEISTSPNSLKTNMSFQEFTSLVSFVNSLPQDRLISRSLNYSYFSNNKLLDDEIKDMTFDSVLAEEKKSIAVLNGAGIPGLAAFGTRISENLGGRVVAVGNASMVYEESVIVTEDLLSETVNYLAHSFGIKKVLLKEQSTHINENELDRADVVVILGIDNRDVL